MSTQQAEFFEPEDLALLGSIFDETWSTIDPGFRQADESVRSGARTRLAALLLKLAGCESDRDNLRQVVLHIILSTPVAGRSLGDATNLR
ncbi:MAG: hypothetical protein WC829_04955 [Hyphomicrobium sp.]|jgi:hypothetical protein